MWKEGVLYNIYTLLKIHLHSTLAKLVTEEEKEETQTQYINHQTFRHKMNRTLVCLDLRTGMMC